LVVEKRRKTTNSTYHLGIQNRKARIKRFPLSVKHPNLAFLTPVGLTIDSSFAYRM
jgi:hypothetical protein